MNAPNHPRLPRATLWTSGCLVLFLCTTSLLQLDDYGVTWDLEQTLFYGERYFEFWQSGDAKFLDFTRDALEPVPGSFDLEESRRAGRISAAHFVWPLPVTLSAASERILFRQRHWFSPIAAHHAFLAVLSALGALCMSVVLARRVGAVAAVSLPILWWLAPAFKGNVAQNLRDVPVTCFLTVSLLTVLSFVERPTAVKALLLALGMGLGAASKITILTAIPVVLVTILGARLLGDRALRLRDTWWLFPVGLLAFLVFVACWPWLWSSTYASSESWNGAAISSAWNEIRAKLTLHCQDFLQRQWRPTSGFSVRPLLEVVATTVPSTLALGALGACSWRWLHRRGQPVLACLLLAWCLIPLVRICLPGPGNYGGVRHFLEFWPAFAALAAIGAERLWEQLQRSWMRWAFCGLCAGWPALAVARSHPYELSYNNVLVGGNSGGRTLSLSSSYDFWGGSLHHGVTYVNEHAPNGAVLLVPSGFSVVQFASFRLRPDLKLLASPATAFVLLLERRDLADHVQDQSLYAFCRESLVPVHEIQRGDAPLLRIYRFDAEQGGAVELLRQSEQWFASRRERLVADLERALREVPTDVDALRFLVELRLQSQPRTEAREALAPFVSRFLTTIPEGEDRERMRLLWEELGKQQ